MKFGSRFFALVFVRAEPAPVDRQAATHADPSPFGVCVPCIFGLDHWRSDWCRDLDVVASNARARRTGMRAVYCRPDPEAR
jgi:hypothetical protein